MRSKKFNAWNLIGSAPSLDSLKELSQRNLYISFELKQTDDKTWELFQGTKKLENMRIIYKNKRYRFEMYLEDLTKKIK